MRDMAERARTGLATLVLVVCATFMGVPAIAMAAPPAWANSTTYSLAGAVYSIYSSQADAQSGSNVKATLTTNADGDTGTVELDPGDYWVVETTVPKGMTQDGGYTRANPHRLTITSGDTTSMTSTDPAQHWTVDVIKRDLESDDTVQGDTRLSDGQFRIRAYAGVLSDSKGALESMTPDVDRTVASTAATKVDVPLGTVLITETKAPTGHSDFTTSRGVSWAIVQCDATGSPHVIAGSNDYAVRESSGDRASFEVRIGNWTRRQPIRIQKRDAKTGTTPQGDNTLAGAKYHVYNASAGPVYMPNGADYAIVQRGGLVCDAETGDDGVATTPNLPYGTYRIVEYEAPAHMGLDDTPITVTVHPTKDRTDTPVYVETTQDNPSETYQVRFQKQDLTTGSTPQGDLSLSGAQIQVTNRSAHAIVYDGRTIEPGDAITTLTTGQDGLTPTISLPHGTYESVETKAPDGYVLDPTPQSFQLPADDGRLLTVTHSDPPRTAKGFFTKTVAGMTQLANYDASGATFDVYNISDHPIKYASRDDSSGDYRTVPVETGTTHQTGKGGWLDTLVSGPDGRTPQTGNLPSGTYGVIETKAPEGVRLYSTDHAPDANGYDKVFAIDADGNVTPVAFDDAPELTTVTVIKRDTDIGDQAQGDATLDGATFSITNSSRYPLPVFDASGKKLRVVQPGSKICDDVTVHATTKDDGYGRQVTVYQATAPVHVPVKSTVTVQEAKPPVGYTLDEAAYTVNVGVDGGTQSVEVEGDVPL